MLLYCLEATMEISLLWSYGYGCLLQFSLFVVHEYTF